MFLILTRDKLEVEVILIRNLETRRKTMYFKKSL